MKRFAWGATLCLVCVTGCGEPAGPSPSASAEREVSRPTPRRWFTTAAKKAAPDFELTALDGGKVRLSEFRGKPVLLSFFAFGCGPCRTETPHISYLAEQHRGDGLVVLAVNAWDEPKEILQQYIEQNNFQQRVLLDGAEVFQRYNIPSERIPTVVWIDRQGMIVDTSVGATNPDHLYRTTRALINGKS